jgi:hypothetical protein
MANTALLSDQRRKIEFCRELGPAARTYEKPSSKGEGTSLVIEAKPIFRSGSFSDSEGFEHEWEVIHLSQMTDHFSLLSSRGVFEDIPIRKGHPDRGGLFGGESRNRMDELVGYITGVRTELRKNPTDGVEYTYLLADLEIIEESAKKNVSSGLWRNMSAEIGPYITNNNAEYWPCLMGVAYVDIPAVEGLKNHARSSQSFSLITEEEGMTQSSLPNNPNPPVPEAKQVSFSINGAATTDFAVIQKHITDLERENTTLRQFRKEAEETGRENFVNSCIAENKIPASQKDAYISYAKGIDAPTFASWKALMDSTPAMSITGAQGAGFSQQTPGATAEPDAKAERISDLKGMISTHSMNNTPVEKIKEMPSYKELIGLDPSFTL